MGIFSAIGGFISSAVHTVGSAISSVASTLVSRLPDVVIAAKIVIETVSTVIAKVSEVLGIAPQNENLEELGAKVMQEDTRAKMPEETAQEYLDYLRNDVKLDEEKFSKMSPEEKTVCSALGTSMVAKSIEEKTGVEIPADFLITIAKSKLKFEQVSKFINAFSENGIGSMGEFTKYITNDLTEDRSIKIGGIVKESLKDINPTFSEEDIQNEIVDMKRSYNLEKNY